MSEQTSITEITVDGMHVGWTYQQDGSWWATAANANRTQFGPHTNADRAQSDLMRHVRTGWCSDTDGRWALLSVRDNNTGTLAKWREASGTVTYLTTDDTSTMLWNISWEVRDGSAEFNAPSGLGTMLQADAKANAITQAISDAQEAIRELKRAEVTA